MYTIDWEEQSRLHSPFYKNGQIEYPLPNGRTLCLQPGAAFGDCSHATTRLCLELLSHSDLQILIDIGTGNGVLALAALLLGAKAVIGVDIDMEALEMAKKNLARTLLHPSNNTTPLLKKNVVRFQERIANQEVPKSNFGIVSNMTAGEQKVVLWHYKSLFERASWVIISGLLWCQRDDFLRILPGKWELKEELQEGEWIAIQCYNLDRAVRGQIAGKFME